MIGIVWQLLADRPGQDRPHGSSLEKGLDPSKQPTKILGSSDQVTGLRESGGSTLMLAGHEGMALPVTKMLSLNVGPEAHQHLICGSTATFSTPKPKSREKVAETHAQDPVSLSHAPFCRSCPEGKLPSWRGEPMRLLLVPHRPTMGGEDHCFARLANELCRRGHVVHAAMMDGTLVPLLAAGVRTHRPPSDHVSGGLWSFYRNLVMAHGLQLVHAYSPLTVLAARWALRKLGVPIIATAHPGPSWDQPGRLTWAARILDLASDTVVGGAYHLTRSLIAHGLDETKAVTIPSGIPLRPILGVGDPEIRASLGVPQEAPVIASVGPLQPLQGHADLLAAMPRIWEKAPETYLLVMGEGPERSRLERMISAGPRPRQIRLLGHREDVPRLLTACDLFCQPSRREVFPWPLGEAMAAGLGVVATDLGGVSEWVPVGCGLRVSPGSPAALAEALGQLLADADRRLDLAINGRSHLAKRLTLDRMVSRYEALFDLHRCQALQRRMNQRSVSQDTVGSFNRE